MDTITEYDNVFQYFRGQSSEDSKTLQNENNVTKALINVLQHSSPLLTKQFLQMIDPSAVTFEPYNYGIQVHERLLTLAKKGVIVGIAENTTKYNEGNYTDKNSKPDASILSEGLAVLIETKIGDTHYLHMGQLDKHKEKFHAEQSYIEQPFLYSWESVRSFFLSQQINHSAETVTGFLLRQFEQLCEINGIGWSGKEQYFNHFPVQTRNLAMEIDQFLWSGPFDIIDPKSTKGIGYKRKGRRGGFAKLCTVRKSLILRFGNSNSNLGKEMQSIIDSELNTVYKRTEKDLNRYTHEAFINLACVNNLNQIKSFIQKAYDVNP
ncbi:hypothetical protein PVOR_01605 [Paenibacillus vortex V453]|uniref:Uncharacterized protein n=1 Tax=Paenibacillus vortex V453 TaxID=715225 RepID=A0A2R9T2N8_9BACL|nr:hypothetical protein [Paenibacillus vortex]EFU43866.1 hypothetical protein PVOR_01605 [Paenibacillus vortex V453]